MRHLANSAATLTAPATHYDLVRPGLAVYGLSPVPQIGAPRDFGLRPAMSLRSTVALTKRVPAGSGVSYQHRYVTEAETTLALVPLGYADGSRVRPPTSARCCSAAAGAGSPAPSAWTSSCSTSGPTRSTPATRWCCSGPGDDGEPTAQDWADAVGTINYEIVTRVGARVPADLRGRWHVRGRRRAGLVGGLVGVVAVGAAAGLAAERYAIGRARLAPDPDLDEPFFALPANRIRRVVADDGVPLHVEEVGPKRAEVTVVFCHGYTQQLAVWHYQRQALAAENPGKLVFWDHRSHGKSGRSSEDGATIDQLGRDLHAVLQASAPRGPRRARRPLHGRHDHHGAGRPAPRAVRHPHHRCRPDRHVHGQAGRGDVRPAGLVAPVTNRVLPWLTRGMRNRPELFERGRRLGTDLAFVATRRGLSAAATSARRSWSSSSGCSPTRRST